MNWELFLVKGDKEKVRGFVHGFVWGAGDPTGVLCEQELSLEKESIASWLFSGPHQRLLVRASLADSLAQALAQASAHLDLSLQSRKPVKCLRFSGQAEAFSPEVAEGLQRALFHHVPAGVAVEEKKEEVERDPGASGTELYAPVHHYRYRAQVTYAGEVTGMLELHQRLAATDFVQVEPIHVEAAGQG